MLGQAACLRDGNLQNAITLWNIHLFKKMKIAKLVKKKVPLHFYINCTPNPPQKKYCSDYGCRIHTDVNIFAVPLGDTDSTSLLSYSQRHYDI